MGAYIMKKTMQSSVHLFSIIFIILSIHLRSPLLAQSNKLTAPVHALNSDGFIRNWLILGAFPNPMNKLSSSDGGYQKDFLESVGGETKAILTISSRIPYMNEGGTTSTASVFSVQTAPSGIFNFDNVFKNVDYKAAYAFCFIESDQDQQVVCYFGSNDDAKVWVNGNLVHQIPIARSCVPGQDKFTFQLKKGLNPVLLKICNRWGDWAFVMEVYTDELLSSMTQRSIIRSLRDIQNLEIKQKDTYSDVFSFENKSFPEIQWVNPAQVEKLLGKFPISVEWYDGNLNKVTKPVASGTYTALVQGISADSIYIRKAKKFYCSDQNNQKLIDPQKINEKNWVPIPKIYGSSKEKPIVKVFMDRPSDAVEISYLAELKGKTDKPAWSSGKYAKSFDRFLSRSQSCPYWLYLPEGYGKKDQKWPVIIYLHGSFLQGSDLSRIDTPIPPDNPEIKNDFPFIVITPQCPSEYDAWPQDLIADLIDEIIAKYDADADRIYLTGHSLGGRGVWNFAIHYPDRLAAIVPVSGTYDHPEDICKIKNLPVWAFHGDADQAIPFDKVNEMVNQLKTCDKNVKFTVYPNAGHGISDITYNNKELYQWLLKQSNHR
jgi:enterochelin esterase-like enzyme